MSSVLDDERREAFLQALQSLYEEQQDSERGEREEKARQEEQLRRDLEEARRLRAENEAIERRRLEEERARRERGASEVDYGIEKTPSSVGKPGSANGSSKGPRNSREKSGSSTTRPPLSSTSKKGKAVAAPPSFAGRAVMVLSNIRALMQQMGATFQSNPYLLMRIVAFILGFLLVVSRKNIRERLKRVLGTSWDKIRATAGMGVKVSYI